MDVASLRLLFCAPLLICALTGNLRAADETSLPSSAVRVELRPGPLKTLTVRMEKAERCGSLFDEDQGSEEELRPGAYQLQIHAEGFGDKEQCFLALADNVSTLQVGLDKDDALTVRQVLQAEQPQFHKGRAGLKKDSYPILGRVIQILKDNPRIRRMEVAVHTDSAGKHWSNMKLTGERADAIVDYMLAQGIAPERLEARGYGSLDPLVRETTHEMRLKNRRVEFLIRDLAPREALLSDH